jgi:D-alanyl-D-alanine carboxypeptidase
MAKSTFSGPVRSLAGFISAGNANVVSLTADTSLTVDSHAGKVLLCNDADGKFTLPSIVATAPGRNDDPNQTNNLGATFTFVIETEATDLDVLTDGTDKFVGGLYTGVTNATGKTFISGASNDVITLNGTTKGGLAGSIITVTAIASAKYAVEGIILGSGTLVTPFADA